MIRPHHFHVGERKQSKNLDEKSCTVTNMTSHSYPALIPLFITKGLKYTVSSFSFLGAPVLFSCLRLTELVL